jgi:hypothetical protein
MSGCAISGERTTNVGFHVDGTDDTGRRCAWIAVIVSDDAKELFAIGQSVKFYDRR